MSDVLSPPSVQTVAEGLPWPKNAMPPAPTVQKQTSQDLSSAPVAAASPKEALAALAALARRPPGSEVVMFDPEVQAILKDMAEGAGAGDGREWERWLNQVVNDALRAYLGG